jgi:Cys-tRNA synthase (O-phospho-L-seryl-tRNA:Cys-tRNA synthase)
MVTKVPHEFSKRLLNAQHMWDEEIQGIKAFVQRIELEKQEEKALRHGSNPRNQDWMSRSMEEVERLTQELKTHQFFAETLQNDLANVQSEMQVLTGSNETTVS